MLRKQNAAFFLKKTTQIKKKYTQISVNEQSVKYIMIKIILTLLSFFTSKHKSGTDKSTTRDSK